MVMFLSYSLTNFIHLEQSESNGKRMKLVGSSDENDGSKAEVEASSVPGDKPAEESTKPSEPPKQDYIHVRARRGQATDSHSLAERVILFSLHELAISNHCLISENNELQFHASTGALVPGYGIVFNLQYCTLVTVVFDMYGNILLWKHVTYHAHTGRQGGRRSARG
jgi:hypothetical protein